MSDLHQIIEHLQAQVKRLEAELASRDAIIARLTCENDLIRQSIDRLSRRFFGVSSEKLSAEQMEFLFTKKDEEGADEKSADTAEATEAPAPPPAVRKKRSTKPRAPRMPEHLPAERKEIIPISVQLDPDGYRRIGEEVSEKLYFEPGRFIRVQEVRPKFVAIDQPTAAPIIAPLPPCLLERSIITPSLLAEILYNRFVLHLPYYRQSEMFAGFGVEFDRKTLCDWALLGSDWLGILYREIQHEHWRCRYRQLDETPIRYLEPGTGKAQQGYLWVSNIPGGSVFFHWHTGRDAAGLDALFDPEEPDTSEGLDEKQLAELRTIIQCDGYQVYASRAALRRWIELSGCLAHVRRKFVEAIKQAPALVAWILQQIGHLYRIEAELREAKAGPALRQAVRAAQSRMIIERLGRLIERLAKRDILPSTLLGKAIQYALGQWEKIQRFLDDGRIEIDNNLVENAIRPTKLGQKNWLFVGNGESGMKCAILYTIVENCRRLKIDVREYLTDVLQRLPAMQAQDAAALTPANWLAARSGRAVATAA